MKEWLIMVGVLLATCIAYTPSSNGGFLWDDPDYIRDNSLLNDGNGLVRIWTEPTASPQYYPVTFTSFWIEHQLWGEETVGYRVTNLLLHCGSALLLWRILRKLEVPGALLAASLFACHPLMVESVAWMTERKNTLSLFFALWSLWFWRAAVPSRRGDSPVAHGGRGRPSATEADVESGQNGWIINYIFCVVFFILSLLSKSVVATLPAVFLVIAWWKQERITKPDWIKALPLLAIGAVMGVITALLEKHHVGATAAMVPELNLSGLQRIVIAGRVIWFYAFKLLLPVNQSFIYPRWEISASPSIQLIAPAAVIVVLATLLLLRNKIGRGPFAAAAIFCGVLFPALGFVNVYPMRFSFVADHFAYHASIAFLVLVAVGVTKLHRSAGFALLVPLVVLTFYRTIPYSNSRSLWEDTHARNPSWMVKMNLGNTIRFDPTSSPTQLQRVDQLYREARDLKPNNPEAHLLVGIMAGQKGNIAEAEQCFREAVRLNPNHAESWYYLGESLRFQNRYDEAIEAYDRALAIVPNMNNASERRDEAIRSKGAR